MKVPKSACQIKIKKIKVPNYYIYDNILSFVLYGRVVNLCPQCLLLILLWEVIHKRKQFLICWMIVMWIFCFCPGIQNQLLWVILIVRMDGWCWRIALLLSSNPGFGYIWMVSQYSNWVRWMSESRVKLPFSYVLVEFEFVLFCRWNDNRLIDREVSSVSESASHLERIQLCEQC